jgi:hypothetical protein
MKLVAWLLLAQAPITQAPARPADPGRQMVGRTGDANEPADDGEAQDMTPRLPPDYTPDPPTQLTIELSEAQGSMLREVALTADDTMSADEMALLRRALERTGLFIVVGIDQAPAALQLRRIGDNEVLATLTARGGERVWVKAVTWPKVAGPAARRDDEARYAKVLEYGRERFIIRPVVQSMMGPTTIYYGGYPGPQGFADPSWGWGNGMIGGSPIPGQAPGAWAVIRGQAEVVDELEFAKIIGNRAVENRIRDDRFKPKLYWALGFGAGAVAGITAGALLYRDDKSNNTRAWGFSLLGLGIGSAVMALLTPTIGNGNKLSLPETEELVASYNANLRDKLDLAPAETQRLDGPGL